MISSQSLIVFLIELIVFICLMVESPSAFLDRSFSSVQLWFGFFNDILTAHNFLKIEFFFEQNSAQTLNKVTKQNFEQSFEQNN